MENQIESNLKELKRLSTILNTLTNLEKDVKNELDKIPLYDVQYDYFMKFVDIFESTKEKVESLDNIFLLNRYTKELQSHWRTEIDWFKN